MLRLNKIRRLLRQSKVWNAYCTRFRRGPLRLVLTKLALDFAAPVSLAELAQHEALLATRPADESLYVEAFKWLGASLNLAYDWAALGRYTYYFWQMNQYHYLPQRQEANVYQNALAANAKKRQHYYLWLHSISLTTPHYNRVVKKVMHRLF